MIETAEEMYAEGDESGWKKWTGHLRPCPLVFCLRLKRGWRVHFKQQDDLAYADYYNQRGELILLVHLKMNLIKVDQQFTDFILN